MAKTQARTASCSVPQMIHFIYVGEVISATNPTVENLVDLGYFMYFAYFFLNASSSAAVAGRS